MLKTLDKIMWSLISRPKGKRYRVSNPLGRTSYKFSSEMSKEDILNISPEYARKNANIERPNGDYSGRFGYKLENLEQKGVQDPTTLKYNKVKFKGEFDSNLEWENVFGKNGTLLGMDWQEAVDKGAAELGWRGTQNTHKGKWIYHAGVGKRVIADWVVYEKD